MRLIVNVGNNWGIGLKNKLLVRIPNDMKFFRSQTIGKVIVMGRNTLESFPQAQPLAGRNNIVLTTDMAYKVNGATVLHSMEELFEELKKYKEEDVYVVGGESIYRQLLPYCTKAYVTKVNHSYDADAYFPNLDEDSEWKQIEESEEQTYFDLEYVFAVYERV
ncbi:MAG: dihydrofolate reductase [Roseburia sp.]|nr:dihydrofolate reductase [Roseburia sp.]MCM1277376.1 dihydrofolate reductase [Robinsoniella sp.]